ncbi:MAG: TRAP transporter small permease [Thermodesulfobacteriota bacterium]
MLIWQKVWRGLTTVDRYLGVIFLFNLIILVLLDTVLRAFSMTPFMGTMELVRCFLIWSVFISLRLVTKENAHIRMGELIALSPPIIQNFLNFLINLAALVIFGIITLSVLTTTAHNFYDTTPTLEIPIIIFFLPTIIGFLLTTIQYAIILVSLIWKKEALRG